MALRGSCHSTRYETWKCGTSETRNLNPRGKKREVRQTRVCMPFTPRMSKDLLWNARAKGAANSEIHASMELFEREKVSQRFAIAELTRAWHIIRDVIILSYGDDDFRAINMTAAASISTMPDAISRITWICQSLRDFRHAVINPPQIAIPRIAANSRCTFQSIGNAQMNCRHSSLNITSPAAVTHENATRVIKNEIKSALWRRAHKMRSLIPT